MVAISVCDDYQYWCYTIQHTIKKNKNRTGLQRKDVERKKEREEACEMKCLGIG
jgi:hypothetical protein